MKHQEIEQIINRDAIEQMRTNFLQFLMLALIGLMSACTAVPTLYGSGYWRYSYGDFSNVAPNPDKPTFIREREARLRMEEKLNQCLEEQRLEKIPVTWDQKEFKGLDQCMKPYPRVPVHAFCHC